MLILGDGHDWQARVLRRADDDRKIGVCCAAPVIASCRAAASSEVSIASTTPLVSFGIWWRPAALSRGVKCALALILPRFCATAVPLQYDRYLADAYLPPSQEGGTVEALILVCKVWRILMSYPSSPAMVRIHITHLRNVHMHRAVNLGKACRRCASRAGLAGVAPPRSVRGQQGKAGSHPRGDQGARNGLSDVCK